jgi:peptidase M28-like protein
MALLNESGLRQRVERFAGLERGSASAGEREAAAMIVRELEELGCFVSVEEEQAHGTYWWPIGLATGAAAAAGLRGKKTGMAVGAAAAAGVADDVTAGPHVIRRALLGRRPTTNVVTEFGDPGAQDILLLTAHYDAAHSGLVFHPELARWPLRRLGRFARRANTTPPTMWGAVAGPALVALGSLLGRRRLRRAGTCLSAGYAAAMLDIARREVVPAANDNATGVAVLLSLAHSLAADPLERLRVILLFTGSEESFMEGMRAFARRHFGRLPRERTRVICLDTLGSPHLLLLEGEGMLRMHEYDKPLLSFLRECADEQGIYLYPGLRFRNATDGLIAMKAGYPTAMLGSVDEFKIPTNYHWPTDTADRVDYGSVADAARLCRQAIERLDAAPTGRFSERARHQAV